MTNPPPLFLQIVSQQPVQPQVRRKVFYTVHAYLSVHVQCVVIIVTTCMHVHGNLFSYITVV